MQKHGLANQSILSRFFVWHSSLILETPYSVSYCFNRLKQGLKVGPERWKRHYSIQITNLDSTTNTAQILIHSSMKNMQLVEVEATIAFHSLDNRRTRLDIEFETARRLRQFRFLIEIPTLILSSLAFPCVLVVLPFYYASNSWHMQKMQTLLADALQESCGTVRCEPIKLM
jgi:hypothetical protein